MRPSRRRWRWSPTRRVRHGSGRRCSAARKSRWCRTRRCREPRGVVPRRRLRRPPRPPRVRRARPVPAAAPVREAPTRSTMRASRRQRHSRGARAGGPGGRGAGGGRGRGGPRLQIVREPAAFSALAGGSDDSGVARGQRAGQDRVAGKAGRGKSGDAVDRRRAAALRGGPRGLPQHLPGVPSARWPRARARRAAARRFRARAGAGGSHVANSSQRQGRQPSD